MTVLPSGQRYRFVVRTNDAFAPKGLAPDFIVEERLQKDIVWLHRRLEDGTELYFVANLADDARTFTATFRAQAESVELWDAIDGSIVGAEAKKRDDGRTDVQLALGPADSVFVLFRSVSTSGRGRARSPSAPHGNNPVLDLSRDWRVTFQPNRGAPVSAHFPALRSLSDHADAGIRCFSGEALYEKSFSIALHGDREGAAATERCDSRQPAVLELGRVCDACRVELNGRDLGIVWRKPWRVDVTDALKDGTNTLRITVANRWINRMIGDERVAAPYPGVWKSWRDKLYLQAEFPPSFLAEGRSPEGRYAFSTLRTRRKDDALKSAGLIGPVKLMR